MGEVERTVETDELRAHQATIRSELYGGMMDAYVGGDAANVGPRVVLGPNFTGSARPGEMRDEIREYERGRYLPAREAMDRLLGPNAPDPGFPPEVLMDMIGRPTRRPNGRRVYFTEEGVVFAPRVFLPAPMVSPGQLYVALSRVGARDRISMNAEQFAPPFAPAGRVPRRGEMRDGMRHNHDMREWAEFLYSIGGARAFLLGMNAEQP